MMGLTLTDYVEEDCPEVRPKQAGDESYNICNLNNNSCLIEHGLYQCDYFETILKEIESDEREEI